MRSIGITIWAAALLAIAAPQAVAAPSDSDLLSEERLYQVLWIGGGSLIAVMLVLFFLGAVLRRRRRRRR